MPAATLQRQDTGEVFVVDGLRSGRELQDIAVTQFTVQRQSVATDNAQPRARGVQLEVTFSETPTVAGVTTGPGRTEEVLAFVEAVKRGVPLTLFQQGYPLRRNLRLTSSALDRDGARLTGTWVLVEVEEATSRTVDLDPIRTPKRTRTPRVDLKAGQSGTADLGAQATTERRPRSTFSAITGVR